MRKGLAAQKECEAFSVSLLIHKLRYSCLIELCADRFFPLR
jgi:hypothetical protein